MLGFHLFNQAISFLSMKARISANTRDSLTTDLSLQIPTIRIHRSIDLRTNHGDHERNTFEKVVDRFGSSREAETYELVLALSAFTDRPRAASIRSPSISIVPWRVQIREALAYLRVHSARYPHWHIPIRR